MQAAQYVQPVQGFSSTYDAAQMVQSQYFAPGLYAAEPQPISYDSGATAGLLHAMPVHEPVMVPPVARPQPTGASVPGNPMWDDFNKRRNAAIRNQGFTTKESAKGPVSATVGGVQQAAGLSQDATNAYLQSIGVAPQGVPNMPQYPAQTVAYTPQQGVPLMPLMPQPQPQVQYMPSYAPAHHMPAMYEPRPAPVQYEPMQGLQGYEPQAVGYPGQAPVAPAQLRPPQNAPYQPAPQGYYPPHNSQPDPYLQPYGGTFTPPQGSPSSHALRPGQELEAEF